MNCGTKETRIRIIFWYAVVSIFLGVSAAVVFAAHFNQYTVAMWAGIHSLYALFVAIVHGTVIRQQFQPNPHSTISQILPAVLLVGVLGMMFSFGVAGYAFGKAIAGKEDLNVTSHYILGIWCILCFKWAFYLFQTSRFYTGLLNAENEDSSPFVVNEEFVDSDEASEVEQGEI